MGSQVGHVSAHHPLCPECGYDLVATVESGGRVCPECGFKFELHELRRQVQKGDWTPTRGLMSVLLHLSGRAVPCLALWIGVLWGVLALAAHLSAGRNVRIVAVSYIVGLLILMTTSVLIGRAMVRRMDEIAGMVSIVVAGIATIATWIVIVAGAIIVSISSPLGGGAMNGAAAVCCGAAMAMIIKTHFFEDY